MFPVISYLWHVFGDILCFWSISYLSERTVSLDISIALMHVRLYLRFLNHILSFLFQEEQFDNCIRNIFGRIQIK